VSGFLLAGAAKLSGAQTAGDRARIGAYYSALRTAADAPSRFMWIHITERFLRADEPLVAWAVTILGEIENWGTLDASPLMARPITGWAAEHSVGAGGALPLCRAPARDKHNPAAG